MKRYGLWFFIILLSLITGYHILNLWRSQVLSRDHLSDEPLLRAIHADPDNPTPYYKLSLLYHWSLLDQDLKVSGDYLQKAVVRNPLEQEYWVNLARIFLQTKDTSAFERAMENIVLVFPAGYQGRWIAGNLWLQQGDLGKATPHFVYLLTHYPNQSKGVYTILDRVLDDPEVVLEKMVPETPDALNAYLLYLYEVRDTERSQKVWRKKVALGFRIDRPEVLRHIDFLISEGEVRPAHELWLARLSEEGQPLSSDSNLITNGGFETDNLPGGGFDWKLDNVPGAEIAVDETVALEGKRSLKVRFNGKENVDFYHVYQRVALKPGTDYELKAAIKTEEVTTKSGMKLEISGAGSSFHGESESFIGNNDWKEVSVIFRSPETAQGGMVRLRREKVDKFDRFISGTVWIDHVRLLEGRLARKSTSSKGL